MTLPEFDPTASLPQGIVRLEASAGTGKTHAITSIVLYTLATTDVTADRIVIVTFTRAAAAELRKRVRERITAAVRALEQVSAEGVPVNDDVISALLSDRDARASQAVCDLRLERLRRARERFDDLTIDTIHGFSQRVLQQIGPTLGIDTAVELVDDVTPLIHEVVTDLLVRALRHAPLWWYRMITNAGVTPERMHELARRIESEPQASVQPDPGMSAEAVWEQATAAFTQQWHDQRHALKAWLDACSDGKLFGQKRAYSRKALAVACDAIDEWCAGPRDGLEAIAVPLQTLTRSGLNAALAGRGTIADDLTVVDAVADLQQSPTAVAHAFQATFAAHIRHELAVRKSARGVWSFSDLLSVLDGLVAEPGRGPDVIAALRQRTDLVLIDEFQDTDPVQWRIFSTVFQREHLVLVGDPKQAIYSFRGADIRTYHAAAASAEHAWSLAVNYRSDQRVLDAVNALFAHDQFGDDGVFAAAEIAAGHIRASDDHRDDRLRDHQGPPAGLRIHQVTRALAEREDGPLPSTWADASLPKIVACEIAAFLARKPQIERDSEWHVARPADIAVLTRTNMQAMRVHAALRSAGVPAVVATNDSVFDSPEADDLARVLAALLNPVSERRLRAALAGVVFGWNAADLADIDDDLWISLAAGFTRWAHQWRRQGIAMTLRTMMAEVDTLARAVGHRRGERAITNLLHCIELLHDEEVTRRHKPAGLAQWFDTQRHQPRQSGDDAELRLDNDTDAVQVLTVHRAKGLQFPVVWTPFLWKVTGQDKRQIVRIHDVDQPDPIFDVSLDENDVKAQQRRKAARVQQWQEDIRATYVALTRARHRNIVHVGPITGVAGSGLGRVLFGTRPVSDEATRVTFEPDIIEDSDEQLRNRLATYASEAIVLDVASAASHTWRDESTRPVAAGPRTLSRTLDRTWQRTSFSRLVRDPMRPAEDDAAAQPAADYDAQPPQIVAAAATETSEVPLARLPRGAGIGTTIHRILEDVDFVDLSRATTLRGAVAAHARGFSSDEQQRLVDGLDLALCTPLGGPFGTTSLSDIGLADRRDELAFDMSIAGGTTTSRSAATLWQIADVLSACARDSSLPLAEVAARLRRRDEQPFRGMLTGSIDLVARVDGRYLLADYKSNWLGHLDRHGNERATIGDYATERLVEAMVAHDYVLQYHLYAVALHRFLRWRVADYDLERDVAGVAYLFLRGMVGPDQPVGHGVFTDCPSAAVIDALDTVLRGDR